jgi:hypothetical protein
MRLPPIIILLIKLIIILITLIVVPFSYLIFRLIFVHKMLFETMEKHFLTHVILKSFLYLFLITLLLYIYTMELVVLVILINLGIVY